MGLIEKEQKTYAIVIADGTIRVQTDKSNPKAVEREIEKSDKTKITKYETVSKGIEGRVIDISFKDSDFGKNINITFEKESETEDYLVLSLSTKGSFGDDFMKKMPNVDFTKNISLSPFSFIGDNGKPIKGITIWQGEKGSMTKTTNYFREGEGKEGKNINGFPSPEGDTSKFEKDDWIMYFMGVTKFLVKHTEESLPKIEYKSKQIDTIEEAGIAVESVEEKPKVDLDKEIDTEKLDFK